MAWQLQEAKAKFSELVQKAIDEGPQTVTRHGKDTVVVLSVEQFKKLEARRPSLLEVLMLQPRGLDSSCPSERSRSVRSSGDSAARYQCPLGAAAEASAATLGSAHGALSMTQSDI